MFQQCLLHRLCWFSLLFSFFFEKKVPLKKRILEHTPGFFSRERKTVQVQLWVPFWVRPSSSALNFRASERLDRKYHIYGQQCSIECLNTAEHSRHSSRFGACIRHCRWLLPMQSYHDTKQLKSNSVNGQNLRAAYTLFRTPCITWRGYSTQ